MIFRFNRSDSKAVPKARKTGRPAATFAAEAQRADHPVAVEPVPVAPPAAREPRRAVQVVGPAHEARDRALDPAYVVGALLRRGGEGPLDERSVVVHQSPPTPASSSSS